jgi:hypothetical protein
VLKCARAIFPKKLFQNPLDKHFSLCYNTVTKRERRTNNESDWYRKTD